VHYYNQDVYLQKRLYVYVRLYAHLYHISKRDICQFLELQFFNPDPARHTHNNHISIFLYCLNLCIHKGTYQIGEEFHKG
jgi:hypothetical protein